MTDSEKRKPSDRGLIGKTAIWFDQAITGTGKGSLEWLRELIKLVEFLDELQTRHPNITLSVWANDCIWIHIDGVRWLGLRPNSKRLRLITGDFSEGRDELFGEFGKRNDLFELDEQDGYRQWFVEAEGIAVLKKLLSKMSILKAAGIISGSHPRSFPGSVREMALQQFELDRRQCPGVEGKTKPHKVAKGDPIEYDHILPHSRGGASSANNIQVLCRNCNSVKRASAL